MISQTNIPKLARLVSMSDAANVSFQPENETLLATVVEEGMYGADVQIRDQPAVESLVAVVGSDTSGFDANVEEYARVLGEGIRNQADKVCKVIVPFLNEVHGFVVDRLNNYAPPTFTIVPFFIAELHDNPTIYDMLEGFKNIREESAMRVYGYPAMSDEAICDTMATGNSVIDAEIAKMVAAQDSGWLQDVYNKYFGGTAATPLTLLSGVNLMDEYMVAFLLTRKFLTTPPEGTDDKELVLMTMLNQLGRILIRTHQDWDGLKSQGHLVLAYPSASWIPTETDDVKIHVVGDNYKSFIDAGGSPELLIGGCVSSRPYTTKEVNEKAEFLIGRYNQYCEALELETNKRAATIIRDGIVDAASERGDSLIVGSGIDGETLSSRLGELRAYVNRISNKDLEDNIYGSIRLVIINTFFDDTDALRFLTMMDAYEARYENLSAREAAYYVAMDLIVDHLTQQVKAE